MMRIMMVTTMDTITRLMTVVTTMMSTRSMSDIYAKHYDDYAAADAYDDSAADADDDDDGGGSGGAVGLYEGR